MTMQGTAAGFDAAAPDQQPTLLELLHRAQQAGERLFSPPPGVADLTPRQYSVMRALRGRSGLTQTELVAATGIDRSTLSELVRRLINRGWLARKRKRDDNRAFGVQLTPTGELALQLSDRAVLLVEQRLAQLLGPQRRADLVEMLDVIIREAERPLSRATANGHARVARDDGS